MKPTRTPSRAPVVRTVLFLSAILAGILLPAALARAEPKPLSNPDASPEAKEVYQYIAGMYGKGILAAQQESTWVNNNPDDEMDYIKKVTGGKLPAIRGLDYMAYNGVTERAIAWWKKGGIPTICWHWGAPTLGTGYEASKRAIDINQALTPGTVLNKAMMADLDRTAAELTKLRDAHVPVLWRPFHELNGNWFWWGKGGPDAFQRLWKLMYTHYTKTHKLNNLIWVCGFTGQPDGKWYPGKDYVDIAGADSYGKGTQNRMFKTVLDIVGPDIPLVYHECGPIPDPDAMVADGTKWVWFMTWHTSYIKTQNTADYVKKIYNHPYVVTLDKLPKFKGAAAAKAQTAIAVGNYVPIAVTPDVVPAEKPYVPPFDAAKAGLTPLFDGKTLKGWVGDPECWKVVNGAIVGVKGNQNLMTEGDYDNFRLIVSTRQVSEPSNHQGIGFWGEHMPAGKYGYGNCLDVMPPMNWMWDYTRGKGRSEHSRSARTWSRSSRSSAPTGRRPRSSSTSPRPMSVWPSTASRC